MLVAAAIGFALVSLAAAAYALMQARRSRSDLVAAQEQLARVPAPVAPTKGESGVAAEALQRGARVDFDARAQQHDKSLLAALLADSRDVAGAEEAIFWRWNPEREALAPVAWSTLSARPSFFDFAQWAPHVQWSFETGVVQTVGPDDVVIVGAACVRRNDRLLGVLSVTHREGLGLRREAAKEWLQRLADQLATFSDLVEIRRRHERHMRQSQALLDAVQRLQVDRGGEGLARTLCETALDLSAARGAVLVRWDADTEVGELHYATEGTGLRYLTPLEGTSVVAEACRSGKLLVLEDARGAASGQALYGAQRVIREPGSVAIIPLTKEGQVLGALVLEGDLAGSLTLEEARPLTVLGAVVSGSLELAWSHAEVDRQARTDPLTGLWNRMHFGEQLQRTLSEADRSGNPVSLVLVDVDHFKKVNDNWGHEAGDAVLKGVARIVQEGVRTDDICVRYGGEEIAILMRHTTSERAVEVAERVRARIAESPMYYAGAEINVTASFGVASYPETVREKKQFFPAADKALYIAKHEGRNRVKWKPAGRGVVKG